MSINHLIKQQSNGLREIKAPFFYRQIIVQNQYPNFPARTWTTVKEYSGSGEVESFGFLGNLSNDTAFIVRLLADDIPIGFAMPVSTSQIGIASRMRVARNLFSSFGRPEQLSTGSITRVNIVPGPDTNRTNTSIDFTIDIANSKYDVIGEYAFENVGNLSEKFLLLTGVVRFDKSLKIQICKVGVNMGGQVSLYIEGGFY